MIPMAADRAMREDAMGRVALECAADVCKREALRYEILSIRARNAQTKAEYLRCRAVCRDLAADIEGRMRDAIVVRMDGSVAPP